MALPPRSRILAATLFAILLGYILWQVPHVQPATPGLIPYFSIRNSIGRVRPPLPYRIISFHRGRADKNLIRLAAQLGFNGVQFQIEGSTVQGLREFAARDATEHLIDFCHSLNMQVTVWVHEFSDLPSPYGPEAIGALTTDNAALWTLLDKRYEWILSTVIPNADGLVLTTVETQINATDTPLLVKLVSLIDEKCRQHGKSFVARTFVWHPDQLDGVMEAVKQMPARIPIMSKVVPQDWQMRGQNAAEIGAVGDHLQIAEYDIAGEYFLRNNVANCMVDLLKKQFDYGLSKNIQGICVRVDRFDTSILFEPQEVNLWALGLLSAGVTDDPEEIWNRFATYRYGAKAAPAVSRSLRTTGDVVAEMLSIGPFTYGDTRTVPPVMPYAPLFTQNWQNWQWDKSYLPVLAQAEEGNAAFIEQIRASQKAALAQAEASLADLEKARPDLAPHEYDILQTRLLSNKVQLQFRSAATLAALHYHQSQHAQTQAQSATALEQYALDLAQIRQIAVTFNAFPTPESFDYLGKTWIVHAPLLLTRDKLLEWVAKAEQLP